MEESSPNPELIFSPYPFRNVSVITYDIVKGNREERESRSEDYIRAMETTRSTFLAN